MNILLFTPYELKKSSGRVTFKLTELDESMAVRSDCNTSAIRSIWLLYRFGSFGFYMNNKI